jgi:hypothetical protein
MMAISIRARLQSSLTDAAEETAREAKQRVSRRGGAALIAMLVPALLFPVELLLVMNQPRFAWLHHPRAYPWELWLMAICGSAATLGGILDWRFHRSGETSVGRGEHNSHVAALAGGGVPLFVLMSIASILQRPAVLLLPVIIVAGYTVVLICYDEFVYHRKRCGPFETLTHRLLTLGNGAAWLAWMHWCFVRMAAG